MKKNLLFIFLLAISVLALAGTAAYFSVFGLTKLFAAAGIGITILAGSLEFTKIVTVSYVYRFWKYIKKSLRAFYVFAVIFIMFLTSVGIYGFLTGAYQQSTNKLEFRDSQIEIAENKRQLFVDQQNRINNNINNANDRIKTLTSLRSQQETRLDTLYNRNNTTSARRTEGQITSADQQISSLNLDITNFMKESSSVNDSIAFYDAKIAELKISDVSNEIGPYEFVSKLTGIPIDNVVNIVALLIVVVFDPLAITLLIGFNQLIAMNRRREDENDNESEEEDEKKENDVIKKLKNLIKKKEKKQGEKQEEKKEEKKEEEKDRNKKNDETMEDEKLNKEDDYLIINNDDEELTVNNDNEEDPSFQFVNDDEHEVVVDLPKPQPEIQIYQNKDAKKDNSDDIERITSIKNSTHFIPNNK